jgi:hypothetical protein
MKVRQRTSGTARRSARGARNRRTWRASGWQMRAIVFGCVLGVTLLLETALDSVMRGRSLALLGAGDLGIAAGTASTTVSALSPSASPDAEAVAPPRVVSVDAAVGALPERMQRLQERYEAWLSTRAPKAYMYDLPDLPPDAPALPDAPDGELTLEKLDEVWQ